MRWIKNPKNSFVYYVTNKEFLYATIDYDRKIAYLWTDHWDIDLGEIRYKIDDINQAKLDIELTLADYV